MALNAIVGTGTVASVIQLQTVIPARKTCIGQGAKMLFPIMAFLPKLQQKNRDFGQNRKNLLLSTTEWG